MMKKNILRFSLLLFVCSCGIKQELKEKTTGEKQLPSIYQLEGNWKTQDGKPFSLAQLKGKKQVVAMVFTHCQYACPRIVSDIKKIQSEINNANKDNVGFVLVSFDTKRDVPKRLKEFALEEGLGNNWILLHGDEDIIRQFSLLVGVSYQQQEDGNFSHSNIISLLDEDGRIMKQQEGLENNNDEILQQINGK